MNSVVVGGEMRFLFGLHELEQVRVLFQGKQLKLFEYYFSRCKD